MNDPLTFAALCQAEKHLSNARQYAGGMDHRAQAKSFVELARIIAGAKSADEVPGFLRHSKNELVAKAAAHTTLNEIWADPEAQLLAASFIGSVAEPDLLSAIGKYARVVSPGFGRALIATGATGDTKAEGAPRVVKNLDLNVGLHDGMHQSSATIVVSQELLRATGEAGRSMFEQELVKALIRACNDAVIASLTDTSTITATAGADPLASLRAGIRAAGASSGYVIAMDAGDCGWLATHEANRGGMGVRGGTFVPGVEVVAIDDLSAMYVLPASRLAVFTGGIEMHPAGHASVNMADSPTSPSQLVSLWQANCVGLMVSRFWRLDGDDNGIVTVA